MNDEKKPDPFAPAAAFQSQFAELMAKNGLFKDLERAAELAARFQFPHLAGAGKGGAFPDIDGVRQSLEFFEKAVRPQFELVTKYADWLKDSVKQDRLAKTAVDLGLFPHFSLLQSWSESASAGSQRLLDTVHEQTWPHIKKQLLQAIERYGRIETSKTVMREAITAHEMQLFHIVPPAIFAHVERACRHVMRQYGAEGAYADWIAKEMSAHGLGAFGGMGVLDVYRRLGDGAFAVVEHDDIAGQLQAPDNNAALHGQMQRYYKIDSLNALLFGNYVFSALGLIEKKPA